jgi:hypothetical protein
MIKLRFHLVGRLDSTLDSQQVYACASTTKSEPLQVENYKKSVVCVSSTMRIII